MRLRELEEDVGGETTQAGRQEREEKKARERKRRECKTEVEDFKREKGTNRKTRQLKYCNVA